MNVAAKKRMKSIYKTTEAMIADQWIYRCHVVGEGLRSLSTAMHWKIFLMYLVMMYGMKKNLTLFILCNNSPVNSLPYPYFIRKNAPYQWL